MKEKNNKKFYILVALVLLLCVGTILFVRFYVSAGNVAQSGDTVKYTFSGNVEEEGNPDVKTILDPENSYDKWNQAEITIGDYQEPMQIEEAVIGHKRGDVVNDVSVTFPQDYQGSMYGLAGKTVKLNITINEVDRCTEGIGCYPVNNEAIKSFNKAYNKFNKDSEKINKEIETANKELGEGKDITKRLETINNLKSDLSSSMNEMISASGDVSIPSEKETITTQLQGIEPGYQDTIQKVNDLNNKVNPQPTTPQA